MAYKAIMLDYDGTLAPTSLISQTIRPSDRVIRAIHEANAKIAVCLVTARPFYQVRQIIRTLRLSGYAVTLNGAQAIDPRTFKVLWQKPVSQESAKKIYKLVEPYHVTFVFSSFEHPKDNRATSLRSFQGKTVGDIYIPNLPKGALEEVESYLNGFSDIAVHRVVGDNSYGLNINNVQATKQNAIGKIAKRLKIKRKDIIGVGDGPNDFPLLMASGLKIAMGNAVKEIKAMADFVAPSVDEDGVAKVLERFVLQ